MQFRISSYPVKIWCCSKNFYLFSVQFRNRTYDSAFEFDEPLDLIIENNLLNIVIYEVKNKFNEGFKINILYNGIKYNFVLYKCDVDKWIDISLFY